MYKIIKFVQRNVLVVPDRHINIILNCTLWLNIEHWNFWEKCVKNIWWDWWIINYGKLSIHSSSSSLKFSLYDRIYMFYIMKNLWEIFGWMASLFIAQVFQWNSWIFWVFPSKCLFLFSQPKNNFSYSRKSHFI